MRLLLLFHICLMLCLASCSSKTVTLPKAPAMTEELRQQLWPSPLTEVEYFMQGALHLQEVDIPLQGRLYRSSDNTLIIALLTSFGSSILEARINEINNEIISQSPILQQHEMVETFILDTLRQAYLSPDICGAEMSPQNPQSAQLRCTQNDKEKVYIFLREHGGSYILQTQISESSIEIEYAKLESSPSFVARQSRYGFSLNLKHSQYKE